MNKIVALFLVCVGCASRPVAESKNVEDQFDVGVKQVQTGKFEEGEATLRNFIAYNVADKRTPAANYHLGEALESQGKFNEAIQAYEKSKLAYQGVNKDGELKALFRSALCFESLGAEERSVIALRQIEGDLKNKEDSPLKIEVLARLAGAYARRGEKTLAGEYFQRAKKGLNQLSRSGSAQNTWLPQTYFSMGQVLLTQVPKEKVQFERLLETLEQGQGFLLKSASMNDENIWSQRAALNLVTAYAVAMDFVRKFSLGEAGDPLVVKVRAQSMRRKWASRMLGMLSDLKIDRTPPIKGKPEKLVTDLFFKLRDVEGVLESVIAEPDVRDVQ